MGGGEGVFSLSFYIDGDAGNDTDNTGREKTSAFKTLAAAYHAALKESDPVRIVVLSNIDVSELEGVAVAPEGESDGSGTASANAGEEENPGEEPTEEPPTAPEPFSAIQDAKVITIAGGGNGPVTLTRSGADGDSVLEIGGGAQVTFTNITINGKKGEGEGKDRRALKIIGDAAGPKTKVTLGNGVIVTGRITASSGMEAPDDKDGSGILVSGNAELAMTGNSKVSDCVTESANYAKGAVVVTEGGVFTMDGASAVSGNTVTSTGSTGSGGGIYVYGGTFTMGGSAEVSRNTVTSTGSTASGGGIYVYGGTFTMGGSAEVSGNTVTNTASTGSALGGGVYATEGTALTMGGTSAVSGNEATGTILVYGGGVCFINGMASMATFEMNDSASVIGNTITGKIACGGGVYTGHPQAESSIFRMNGGSVVSGNVVVGGGSTSGGGGIFAQNSEVTMNGGKIETNEVRENGSGGGMYIKNTTSIVTLNNGAVVGGNKVNAAAASGGGMFIKTGNITMNSGSTVSGNTATGSSSASGGGVNFSSTGTFTMTGGTVSENKAVSTGTPDTSTGGGLVQTAGTFVMSGGTIYGNTAGDTLSNTAAFGAAYYKTGGNSELESSETTITDGVAAEAVVSGE